MTEWRNIAAPAASPTPAGSHAPAGKVKEIDHPAYYNTGTLEVIDAIEGLGLNYHLGNALKYIARAGKKDPNKTEVDLLKAVWYINRYIELLRKEKS